MPFELKEQSNIYGDRGYTNYEIEDMMKEAENIYLQIERKSKQQDKSSLAFIKNARKKRVEESISDINKLFLRTIHATTIKEFILKIILFVFAIQLKNF